MEATEDVDELFRIPWCVGIIISILAILVQIACFVTVQSCRKFDEIVLCQMSCARVLVSVCEHVIIFYDMQISKWMKFLVYIAYYQTDLVLLFWMCLFTKHLYEKIVVVFHVKKYNFVLLSLSAWLLPLPVAVPCPFLIQNRNPQYFTVYFNVINHLKFLILLVNVTAFVKIFLVASHCETTNRNLRNYVKSAVVGFLLVLITSFQVLMTDLISASYDFIRSKILVYTFCVINSYQVLAILIIFILLVRGKIIHSNTRSVRLSNLSSR